MGWLDNFAGIAPAGFFSAPEWVDHKKPAGHTSQIEELGFSKSAYSMMTLRYFFYSPNLIWFAITAMVYIFFPYDLEAAAKGWSLDWVGKRFAFNYALAFCYYGFFFWTLYVQKYAQRKFKQNSFPTASNMAHDLWYWSLGVLQWTLSECAMTWLWATGKVPYVSNAELLSSPRQILTLFVWVLIIPQWRDLHFYFAHRFSHIRAFYKYVHSVHHRDADPEPFSGMCMHPVEHLVYFSNALTPSLYLGLSPMIYMWNFLHLTLAPGAGHSGWEDHWQADQYHYLHHAKFECNYGSPSTGWIDQYFGTFREKLGTSEAYTGEGDDKKNEDPSVKAAATAPKVWSPQGYLALQMDSHLAYTCFCIVTTALLVWATAVNMSSADPIKSLGGIPLGTIMGSLVAYGPVAFAILLCLLYDKMPMRWPFHKEPVFGAFGVFLVMGWVSCLLPIYHFVQALTSP